MKEGFVDSIEEGGSRKRREDALCLSELDTKTTLSFSTKRREKRGDG